jgi:hypothetical protein
VLPRASVVPAVMVAVAQRRERTAVMVNLNHSESAPDGCGSDRLREGDSGRAPRE